MAWRQARQDNCANLIRQEMSNEEADYAAGRFTAKRPRPVPEYAEVAAAYERHLAQHSPFTAGLAPPKLFDCIPTATAETDRALLEKLLEVVRNGQDVEAAKRRWVPGYVFGGGIGKRSGPAVRQEQATVSAAWAPASPAAAVAPPSTTTMPLSIASAPTLVSFPFVSASPASGGNFPAQTSSGISSFSSALPFPQPAAGPSFSSWPQPWAPPQSSTWASNPPVPAPVSAPPPAAVYSSSSRRDGDDIIMEEYEPPVDPRRLPTYQLQLSNPRHYAVAYSKMTRAELVRDHAEELRLPGYPYRTPKQRRAMAERKYDEYHADQLEQWQNSYR